MTVLYIKNMVCQRCIWVIQQELDRLHIPYTKVELGQIHLTDTIEKADLNQLDASLSQAGFERIDDKKKRIVEQTKLLIIDWVHHQPRLLPINWSDYLSSQLQLDYTYVSNLFSEIENITIEKYFILQKIEKAKELLVYDEFTLSEIAMLLHYSSVAYLSNQFKKITGLSPSQFKKTKVQKRKPIDQV